MYGEFMISVMPPPDKGVKVGEFDGFSFHVAADRVVVYYDIVKRLSVLNAFEENISLLKDEDFNFRRNSLDAFKTKMKKTEIESEKFKNLVEDKQVYIPMVDIIIILQKAIDFLIAQEGWNELYSLFLRFIELSYEQATFIINANISVLREKSSPAA